MPGSFSPTKGGVTAYSAAWIYNIDLCIASGLGDLWINAARERERERNGHVIDDDDVRISFAQRLCDVVPCSVSRPSVISSDESSGSFFFSRTRLYIR